MPGHHCPEPCFRKTFVNTDSRIGVTMLTHNRRQEVLHSLWQLTALAERPAIALVDNASTDGTAEAVAAEFPEVKIIRSDRNLGAAGRNLGLRHLQTPYVAMCDDDTWWDPGGLGRAADLFDAHPQLALVTARVLVGREETIDPTCLTMHRSPLPAQPGMPGPPILGFLAGASVVRREAFLDCGGFSERLFLGGEEQWVAVELAARGWWMCYVPELVVHHHPSPCREVTRRRWHEVRNSLWFAWMRRPMPSALRRTAELARQRPAGDFARGAAAAVVGLPRMLGQRRIVPPAIEAALRRLEARDSASIGNALRGVP